MLPRRWMMALGAAILVCTEAAAATDQMTSVTEEIVEVLKTIEDAKSAKAAVPKLDALADQMLELRECLRNALNKPAKSRRGPQADHAKRLAQTMDAYAKELERIDSIPGAA